MERVFCQLCFLIGRGLLGHDGAESLFTALFWDLDWDGVCVVCLLHLTGGDMFLQLFLS